MVSNESGVLDFFLKDDYDEEDATTVTEPKLYITLWPVLSTWITSQSIKMLQYWKNRKALIDFHLMIQCIIITYQYQDTKD